jgi:hypothetical protein
MDVSKFTRRAVYGELLLSYPLESSTSRRPFLVAGIDVGVFVCEKEIMVTRKPNWSFRDSKARDWLRKGKVLAPLVRPT